MQFTERFPKFMAMIVNVFTYGKLSETKKKKNVLILSIK